MSYAGFCRVFAVAVAVVAGALAFGCSDGNGDDPEDCKLVAAFDLTVRAVPGPLPQDTTLEVQYGGGTETFRVDQGVQAQEVVLCDDTKKDASAGDGGVPQVHCKLWTQGAAKVTVTATGYSPVEEALEAKAKGKCIQTVPIEILLGDPDGGT